MKTIDQETIDFAYDFFFKLSDVQLKEKVAEFKVRQREIHQMIEGIGKQFPRKDNVNLLWRFNLMMDYCFNTCCGNLPSINNKAILDYFKMITKEAHIHVSDTGGVDHNYYLSIVEQYDLMTFVSEKINDFFLEKILEDNIANIFILTVSAIGNIYKKEEEKIALQ
jgi:hypothetical protein